jgi:succinoglycan biosynthesis protein ExoA
MLHSSLPPENRGHPSRDRAAREGAPHADPRPALQEGGKETIRLASQLPFVSVVMPVRNEAHFIGRSLGMVLEQDYPHDRMEVIVADGMSTDDTRKIVQEIVAKDNRVRLIDNRGRTTPPGLNAAISACRGAIVARVDGHCLVSPDYLGRCVVVMLETGADNVGGLQTPVGTNSVGRAIALATSSPFGVGNSHFRYHQEACWTDGVFLGTYRREVFRRIGDYDEELTRNQDDEFNMRLTQAGGRIRLDPSIRSIYFCRSDFVSLWRQYFQYGLYKIRVMQKRRVLWSIRHVVPGLFVAAGVLFIFLTTVCGEPAVLTAVVGSYALCNLVFSAFVSRGAPQVLHLVPLAFLILHLSYGLGSIVGLWRWRKHFRIGRDS